MTFLYTMWERSLKSFSSHHNFDAGPYATSQGCEALAGFMHVHQVFLEILYAKLLCSTTNYDLCSTGAAYKGVLLGINFSKVVLSSLSTWA